jgi:deoxyribonuclease-4
MFGSHLSIAGNLSNAVREAESLGMDTVQVFTKNQQQWKVPPLKDETILEWRGELDRLKWGHADDAHGRTVSHASYLINLASPDPELWKKSVALMIEEVARCEALGIGYLVHHPGAYTTGTLEGGTELIANAYAEIFDKTAGFKTISCLENTAGGGSLMGGSFDHLARLREAIITKVGREAAGRIAFCFDTCHAHAAGYDMSSLEAATVAIDAFDRVCGLEHMVVLHLNDSKGKVGSHLDRHEHIGKGEIGVAGFAGVLNHPVLAKRARPMILETPKGENDKGAQWDTINLRQLRKLRPGTASAPPVKSKAKTKAKAKAKKKTPAGSSRGGRS